MTIRDTKLRTASESSPAGAVRSAVRNKGESEFPIIPPTHPSAVGRQSTAYGPGRALRPDALRQAQSRSQSGVSP